MHINGNYSRLIYWYDVEITNIINALFKFCLKLLNSFHQLYICASSVICCSYLMIWLQDNTFWLTIFICRYRNDTWNILLIFDKNNIKYEWFHLIDRCRAFNLTYYDVRVVYTKKRRIIVHFGSQRSKFRNNSVSVSQPLKYVFFDHQKFNSSNRL